MHFHSVWTWARPGATVLAVGAVLTAGSAAADVPVPTPDSQPSAERKVPASAPEVHPLVRLAGAEAQEALESDPDFEPSWVGPVRPAKGPLTLAGWSYAFEGKDNVVVARVKGEIRWQSQGRPADGGKLAIRVSPKGTVLLRDDTKGGSDLYDARSGGNLGRVGRAWGTALDPQEHFLVSAVRSEGPPEAPTRVDIQFVPLTSDTAERKLIANVPLDSKSRTLGIAVSATGEYFAYSTPHELVVFRTADHAKVATAPNPPDGHLAFTQSGRSLVVRALGGKKLLAAYRIAP